MCCVHIDFNLKDTPLVRFKQDDINNASLELACYKRVGRDNELGKVVSISQSDGLSDSEDELKKLRVNLGKAVAASRRNLGSKTTRKGTRSQKDATNITTEVSPSLLTLNMK